MHPRLREITEYLSHVRSALAEVIDSTPEDRFLRKPASGWCGAQIVQHMGKVEGASTKMLETLLASAIESGLPMDAESSSLMHSLDRARVPDRTAFPVPAPERLAPTADAQLAASWTSLQQVRERTLKFVASVDGRDLTRVSYPHVAMGPLNGYQWILFVGQHEERHLAQLRDVLRSA